MSASTLVTAKSGDEYFATNPGRNSGGSSSKNCCPRAVQLKINKPNKMLEIEVLFMIEKLAAGSSAGVRGRTFWLSLS
jgi:hypothetical protein